MAYQLLYQLARPTMTSIEKENIDFLDRVTCGSDSYDKHFLGIPHYTKHPEFLPFVGTQYANMPKKILLVGESHYIMKGIDTNQVIEDFNSLNWYKKKLSFHNISESNVFYRCFDFYVTKNITWSYVTGKKKSGGYTIFSNPMRAYFQRVQGEDLQKFAFMNFYQRPAFESGKTLCDIDGEDTKVAQEVFRKVINILHPDIVIFLSKKAYDNASPAFSCRPETKFIRLRHPTCSWWHRKTKGEEFTSKELFRNTLTDAWGPAPQQP